MSAQDRPMALVIHSKRLLYIFCGAAVVVVILSFIAQYLTLHPNSFEIHTPIQANLLRDFTSEFDFHAQPNISIYFTTLLLNIAALFLFVIAHFKKDSKDAFQLYWTAFAWIILLSSIDNLALLRNKLPEYFQDGGKAILNWAFPLVLVLIFGLVFYRFWRHFDGKFTSLLLTSIVLYFGGVLTKQYALFGYTAVEQILQYGGVILLIHALLLYIQSQTPLFFVNSTD